MCPCTADRRHSSARVTGHNDEEGKQTPIRRQAFEQSKSSFRLSLPLNDPLWGAGSLSEERQPYHRQQQEGDDR